MREILTLQIGSYANYVGAHFWNFQDELIGLTGDMEADEVFKHSALDMDVLYRAGVTRQGGSTYVPRLIAIDLRGSLGAVRSSGCLQHEATEPAVTTWSGRVERHAAPPAHKNEFLQRLEDEEGGQTSNTTDEMIVQKLDAGVESWTDYLKTQLHHRSVLELQDAWSGITKFDDYGCGLGLLSGSEELQERLRYFAEECDHLQGVQAIVDDSGGFSGVAADVFSHFQDEYGDKSLMIFTVRPPEPELSRSVARSLHDAVSLAGLSSAADLLIPLGLPGLSKSEFARHLIIEDSKPFHTSAVYAAAIHGVTTPFRMGSSSTQTGACDMNSLVKNLSYSSRKVAHLAAALPAPHISDDKNKPGLTMSLLPFLTSDVAPDLESDEFSTESLVYQGVRRSGSRELATISEVMTSLAEEKKSQKRVALNHVAYSCCPLPVPLPFPSIFGSFVGRYGDVLGDGAGSGPGRGALEVFTLPVATALRTDNRIAPYLSRRLNDLDQLAIKRGARGSSVLEDWGFAREEAGELREDLSNVLSRFSVRTEMDSD